MNKKTKRRVEPGGISELIKTTETPAVDRVDAEALQEDITQTGIAG
jgi:hypothetical protein